MNTNATVSAFTTLFIRIRSEVIDRYKELRRERSNQAADAIIISDNLRRTLRAYVYNRSRLQPLLDIGVDHTIRTIADEIADEIEHAIHAQD